MFPKKLALSLIGLAATNAVLGAGAPEVVPELLPGGCSEYDSFDPSTGNAGPFAVVADSTGEYIDGNGMMAAFSRGSGSIRWGNLGINNRSGIAIRPLRCDASAGMQGWVPTGVSGSTWETVVAAGIPYSALLMYLVDGTPVEPYAHYAPGNETERLPGIFLGSKGVTTWGFILRESAEFGTYWEIRLLGEGSEDPITGEPLKDGEITGFLKVVQ